MSSLEITAHALRVDRKSLFWWALGLVFTTILFLVFYPSIADNAAAYRQAIEGLPDALKAFAGGEGDPVSPGGYMQGQFFASLGAWLFFAFGVARGGRAIAGDEDDGTLELVVAAPVGRARIVAERALAMAIELAVVALVTWLTLVILGPPFELDLPASDYAAGVVGLAMGAWVFGALALAVGAATGRPGVAYGVGGAAAALAFLCTVLAPLTDILNDRRELSPGWQSFGTRPIETGFHTGDMAILAVEGLVFIAVGTWLFLRRDIH